MKPLYATLFASYPAIILMGALLIATTLLQAGERNLAPSFKDRSQAAEQEFQASAGSHLFILRNQPQEVGIYPEDHRTLSLLTFEISTGIVYGGKLTLEWIKDGQTLHTQKFEFCDDESLYTIHQPMPEPNNSIYALHVTLHDHDDLECVIYLSNSPLPRSHLGRWIGGTMLLLLVFSIVTARKLSTKNPPITGTAAI